MEYALPIIIAVIGSGAFSTLVAVIAGGIQRRMEEKRKKNSVQDRALSMLLLMQLQEYGNDILKEDIMDPEQFKQFEEMFNIYKEMGGNGYADKLMSDVAHKPLRYYQ